MSRTSQSPKKVLVTAWLAAKQVLPDYTSKFSPKTYTQPQLFACLVLMTFLRTDYRGIEAILWDLPDLRRAISLRCVPDHSTLHKAAKRILTNKAVEAFLETTLRMVKGRSKKIELAACDSSGLESGHRSPYFVMRRQRGQKQAKNPQYQTTRYTRYPKVSLLVDCNTHMAMAMLTTRGPSPDMNDLPKLMGRLPKGFYIKTVMADAGYDSQANHDCLRQDHGVQSIIPPLIGRPTKKRLKGPTRELMRSRWARYKGKYGQRWQVETTNSMIKRNLGDELSAVGYHAQCRQLRLLVLTHNVMV